MIYVELSDGRIIGVPGDRFRILKQATNEQLAAVKVEVNGYALRWEELGRCQIERCSESARN
ncbi:hypothetical protein MYAER_3722 [Microcystis aeruginosa NIES-2549]|nr:hypothetical protein MYAER_3722 [Microcystis aeruginosa NIES-2549]AOC54466.1 hypothetical protein amyaer_3769 [Microcystis aeruginosa NIES-2481]